MEPGQLYADSFLDSLGHMEVHYTAGWEDGLGGKLLVIKNVKAHHPCKSRMFTIVVPVVRTNVYRINTHIKYMNEKII